MTTQNRTYMANKLYIDGTALPGITVLKSSVYEYLPNIELDIQNIPYGGAVIQFCSFPPKIFKLDVLLEREKTDSGYETLEHTLNRWQEIIEVNYNQYLALDDFYSGLSWLVRWRGMTNKFRKVGVNHLQGTMEFISSISAGYGAVQSDDTTADSEDYDWDVIPDDNPDITGHEGTGAITPVTTVTNKNTTGSDTISAISVEVGSNVITYTDFLSGGDMIKFDSDKKLVYKSTDDGDSWSESMASVSGTFPILESGTNSMNLKHSNVGATQPEINVTYRNKYEI